MMRKATNADDMKKELVRVFKMPINVANLFHDKQIPQVYNCYWEQDAKNELVRLGVKKEDIESLTGEMLELVSRIANTAYNSGLRNC